MRKFLCSLNSNLKSRGGGNTLVIQEPRGRVLYPAFCMLIALFVLGEFVFSQNAVQTRLMGPRIGSRHRQFEVQWARLEKLRNEGKPIDCIFLGNSMIWIDVNPLVVSQAFQSSTGQEIHCFNFGVSALPASSAGLVARVLVERYHPKYLIYGTFARDYAVPVSSDDATAVSDTPWLRYQIGNFNLEGWLYDHSSFYQYKGYMPDVLTFNLGEVLPGYNGFPPYHDYGFDPKMNVRIDVQKSPDMNEIGSKDPRKWLYHYEVLDENLEGLRDIVSQSDQGAEIIVIEMPFYPTAFEFFLSGENDYDKYVEQVAQISESGGAQFWGLKGQPEVPKEDWWDYFHMNIHGAQIFSEWLGHELGEVVLQESGVPVASLR